MTLGRLISFTQLYTPDWVVDFLLQNTLLCSWTKPSGNCFPQNIDTRFVLPEKTGGQTYLAHELTLIDPACGSGNFLIKAFDLLLSLYQAEGASKSEATRQILSSNLAGVDIDSSALWVSVLSLWLKAYCTNCCDAIKLNKLAHVQNPACPTDKQLLGTLWPDWQQHLNHPLNEKYHAVLTNPPYIGRKLLDRSLKAALKELYPDAHQDLCAAFVRRSMELLQPGGRFGAITQAPLMFLPSYGELRQNLINNNKLIAAVDAGPGVFPLQGGEKVNSALLLIESTKPNHPQEKYEAIFLDVQNKTDKETYLTELVSKSHNGGSADCYSINPLTFSRHRKYSFNYKCPPLVLDITEKSLKLSCLADVRQGLATTDNGRFVRYWWDVSPSEIGKRWFPYVKGAGAERWFSPIRHVVDWANNGAAIKESVAAAYPYLNGQTAWVVKNEEYYFQEGLTFSFVSNKSLCVRHLPPNCIFDVGGSALFTPAEDRDFLLSYLNSSFIAACAQLLNPTLNFQVGDLKQLPYFEFAPATRDKLAEMARQCHSLKQQLFICDATAYGAIADGNKFNNLNPGKSFQQYCGMLQSCTKQLEEIEEDIDETVLTALSNLLGITAQHLQTLKKWILDSFPPKPLNEHPESKYNEFIHSIIFERLSKAVAHTNILLLPVHDLEKIAVSLNIPLESIREIEAHSGFRFTDYLLKTFATEHKRQFRGHPLYHLHPLDNATTILVLPTTTIRALSGEQSKLIKQATYSGPSNPAGHHNLEPARSLEISQNLILDLVGKLSAIPDWTAANVATLI